MPWIESDSTEIMTSKSSKSLRWLPNLRLHDTGFLMLSIKVSEMLMVVRAPWQVRSVSKQKNKTHHWWNGATSRKMPAQRLVTRFFGLSLPLYVYVCLLGEEEQVVSSHCLSRSNGKSHSSDQQSFQQGHKCSILHCSIWEPLATCGFWVLKIQLVQLRSFLFHLILIKFKWLFATGATRTADPDHHYTSLENEETRRYGLLLLQSF